MNGGNTEISSAERLPWFSPELTDFGDAAEVTEGTRYYPMDGISNLS